MALINCPECNKEVSDKAGACPNCGHPIEKTTPVAALQHDTNKKFCPTCKSDNTQTVKMTVMSGTTAGKSTAVGINTNLDVGVASVGTRTQTTLAASLNPGQKPSASNNMRCGLIAFGIAGFFGLIGLISLGIDNTVGGHISAFVLSILLTAAFGFFGYTVTFGSANAKAVSAWEKKNRQFETGWICHRCGHTWLP